MRFPGYRTRLLGGLGIAPAAERLRFLEAWSRAEGGTARFNAWNTTYYIDGSSDYNRVHVKHYADATMGTAATLLTLRLSPYRALVAALGANGLTAEQICRRGAAGLNTWGTGSAAVLSVLKGL